jgi:phage tail-like protein
MISQQRALVRMPDVVGMTYKKAKLILENAGLAIDGLVFQESYEPRDTVLSQKPGRGQMIYTGEKVILGVSRESYIKWLPSMYQRSDINGRNFIRDLLWVVQHMFGSIDETLDGVHNCFDPYEAPEKFLSWLASWSAMVLDEDWPLAKKRRLIRKAIELYRVRGTVKGLKLFLGMFTGTEPIIHENEWPFKGWRIGVTSGIGVDTVVLPPVNLSHAFIIEMPVSYKDISTETMVRIHEIIQMEKPANCQYYLKFAVDKGDGPLQEFFTVGEGGIGVGAVDVDAITSEEELNKILAGELPPPAQAENRTMAMPAMGQSIKGAPPPDDEFASRPRTKPPLKAPRADTAPIEGQNVGRTMMAQAVDYPGPASEQRRTPERTSGTEARTVMREVPREVSEKKTVMKDVRSIESDKTMTIDAIKDKDDPKKKR